MKVIGIFEAKTRFSDLCAEVQFSGTPVLVQKRGHPLVLITPVPPDLGQSRPDIHSAWQNWQDHHATAERDEDFPEVWKHRSDRSISPLED